MVPEGCGPLRKDPAEDTERSSGKNNVIVRDPGLPWRGQAVHVLDDLVGKSKGEGSGSSGSGGSGSGGGGEGSDVARRNGSSTGGATGSLTTVNMAAAEREPGRNAFRSPHDKRAAVTRIPITQSPRSNPLLIKDIHQEHHGKTAYADYSVVTLQLNITPGYTSKYLMFPIIQSSRRKSFPNIEILQNIWIFRLFSRHAELICPY
jgi:hypothetical protein